MFPVSSCICLCPIYWSHVLSGKWCSWSSADRQCSNYIWVTNNLISHKGGPYIRDLTVYHVPNCLRAWYCTVWMSRYYTFLCFLYVHDLYDNKHFWIFYLDSNWDLRPSTLDQVMACCLAASSHYLNQCWLLISKVQWHPSHNNSTRYLSNQSLKLAEKLVL